VGRTADTRLETVGPENLADCGIGCLLDSRSEGRRRKLDWLPRRFAEGLRLLLVRDGAGKPLAFLEYVPGEAAWRPVEAGGWLFVHCLWVFPRGKGVGGLGSRLLRACIEEAARSGARGVAALASSGPWMAGPAVFRKNGFEVVDERDRFELLAHRLRPGPLPAFRELAPRWKKQRGLHVVHCAQCPFLPESVEAITELAREHGLEVKITRLRSAREAQRAPSYYGVFGLLWNGELLSDHYVSRGRFRNLLKRRILVGRK
jgi:hypothetical protein